MLNFDKDYWEKINIFSGANFAKSLSQKHQDQENITFYIQTLTERFEQLWREIKILNKILALNDR